MIDNGSIHNFGQVIDSLAVRGSLPNFIAILNLENLVLYKKIICNSLGLFASNICLGKTVSRNNVHSSKPICRSNVCQSKPTNANIFPGKPVLTDHVNSSILSRQLFLYFCFPF